MKKFFLAALATTTAVSAANAGTLNFDARADYDTLTYQDSPTQLDSNKFYFKTIRLDYQGKVNEDLSYRLRAAYNKNATTTAGAGDNSQTALEFAYITHKMGDLSLQMGKLGSEYGTFESQTSGADLYLTSQAYTKTGPNGALVGQYLSSSNLLYVLGAKLAWTITPDQSLSLVAFKTPDTLTATTPPPVATSNAMMEGLIYKGAFMEKTLKVMASYHYGVGTNSKDKYNLGSAGINWSFLPTWNAEIDYTTSSFEADAGGAKDSINSIIGKVAYTGFEQWTPRLEVISSEEKVETNATATNNGTNKFMGYGAVVEFKPIADTNFRYHVAYSNTTQEMANSALKDAKVDQITVGVRLNSDLLK
ncbi:porin [Bdellovibrio sp. HCB209]|uniref:porin n=1 Tax=Bdellovibrio sp. HCB209 TaxID=3394354 RepID=UPI0039B65637